MAGRFSARSEVVATMTEDELRRFVPLNGLMVVKRDATPTMQGKLIVIAKGMETLRYKPTTGTVLKTGRPARTKKGKEYMPTLKAGDRVLIGRFAGHDFDVGGENYLIMDEADILGTLASAA